MQSLQKYKMSDAGPKILRTILILILCIVQQSSASTWQQIATGQNIMPAQVYQTYCNNGQRISGVVYWTGISDLDLFLYINGANMISQTAALRRYQSYSLNSRQTFVYDCRNSSVYYLRVKPWSLTGPITYYINISTNSIPTITRSGYINNISFFMTTSIITNMPVLINATYYPVRFTISSTNTTNISIILRLYDRSNLLKRQLTNGVQSCLSNNNTANLNQSWELVFRHTWNTPITQLYYYTYSLQYSDDISLCDQFCQPNYLWDNSTMQCVQQSNSNDNINTDDSIVTDPDYQTTPKTSTAANIIFIVLGSASALFVIVAAAIMCWRRRSQPTVSPINNTQQKIQRQIDSMTQINMLEKNVCAICLGQACNAILPCQHVFHRNCIELWYKKKHECPNCRKQFKISGVKIKPMQKQIEIQQME